MLESVSLFIKKKLIKGGLNSDALTVVHAAAEQLSHSFLGLDQLPIVSFQCCWISAENSFGGILPASLPLRHRLLSPPPFPPVNSLTSTRISGCRSAEPPQWRCANIPTVSETPCEFQSNISPHVFTSGFFAVPPFVLISSLFDDPFLEQVTWKRLDVCMESPGGNSTAETKGMAWCYCNYLDARTYCDQSCPILYDSMDCSPTSSIHGIFKAKNAKAGCHFLYLLMRLFWNIMSSMSSNASLTAAKSIIFII